MAIESRIRGRQVVEADDFACGRGLVKSSEHRNLLPLMLEEGSWEYKEGTTKTC